MTKFNYPQAVELIRNDGPHMNPDCREFDGDVRMETSYEAALHLALLKGFSKDELWVVVVDMDDIQPLLMRPKEFEEGYEFENSQPEDWEDEEIQPLVCLSQRHSYTLREYMIRVFMPKTIEIKPQ